MANPPKRVARCTTHHACDCIQYRADAMESALKIIRTWADYGYIANDKDYFLELIAKKSKEALDCLEGIDEK